MYFHYSHQLCDLLDLQAPPLPCSIKNKTDSDIVKLIIITIIVTRIISIAKL